MGFMGELSLGSPVAILAQGDTQWVQVFRSRLERWLFVTFDLPASLLLYICVDCLFLLNFPKNNILNVRGTKFEDFDITGSRHPSDPQPQDISVVYNVCCRGMEPTCRFGA